MWGFKGWSQIRNLPLSLSENWYESTFPQVATPTTLQDYYIHSSTYPMNFHIGEMIREPLTFLRSRFNPHQATLKKSVFSGQSRKNMIMMESAVSPNTNSYPKEKKKKKIIFASGLLWSFIRLERCFPNFWLIFLLLNGKPYTLDAIAILRS